MCKVSIIVPVHDSERYLRACVASLTAQTHRDIEIVLVENASSDSSLELCRKLSETDSRIKVLHLDLGDPAYARNEGIKVSEGVYLRQQKLPAYLSMILVDNGIRLRILCRSRVW